ncbi:phosphatase [Pseudoxanthomonas kalamensis DSM 18571]|uniref:alkaline phosphatase PhoX n=1 Tax=Pseudoxanthomonas kalamensis TaxID=289483 RepID=UPI001390B826|nr:alkaline phosphatase PhoX [Pseudoxanthomonas kalamensis]KAF1711316.1 phosphatase [Pseudoxanthomonas kalamensis DSM 18571]
MVTRRQFTFALTGSAFAGLLASCSPAVGIRATKPLHAYGDLAPDPAGLLDLPKGFGYRVISAFGQRMDDGFVVPDRADGMGCFALGERRVALVRNHELKANQQILGPAPGTTPAHIPAYDRNISGDVLPGGTSTIIYNLASGQVESQHLSLVGTIRNCAGGTTPWGSWLTCEEDVTRAGEGVGRDHGWVFEVPAEAHGLVPPTPLVAMGRFNHEAAAVDPRTGIVYLTEDRDDSLLYRFLPDAPGDLARGGRLQALALVESDISDSRNWHGITMSRSTWHEVRWIDLDDVKSPDDDLRMRGHARGALLFARGEGIHFGEDELYFCCTSGGVAILGQIMRYKPSRFEGLPAEKSEPGRLQIFVESTDPAHFNFGDNLTVAPNGHLIVCEDQYTAVVDNHLRGVTPDGDIYTFARLRLQTELAGACFSPDGSTLFVNLYSPGKTLAITGPWAEFRS